MTPPLDLLLIAQSEVVNYDDYAELPLDRVELYQHHVYPRMIHYRGRFRSQLDCINLLKDGVSFAEAEEPLLMRLLTPWNLPSLGGMHLANALLSHGIRAKIINNFDAEWQRFCEIDRSRGDWFVRRSHF